MRARAVALLAALIVVTLPVTAARAETVTLPSGAATGSSRDALIYQVSCPAAGDCVGVGAYEDTSGDNQALIESESAAVWSAANIPDASLPDAGTSPPPLPYLTGVDCTSAENCVAVDAYDDSSGNEQGLIDTDADGVWTVSQAPLAGLSSGVWPNPGVEVADVACPALDACVGIGSYVDSASFEEGLIETQSAGGWSASEMPLPVGSDAGSAPGYYDISCASVGECAAVGYYTDSSGDQQGLLESDSGGSWSASELDLSELRPSAGEPPAANPQASVDAVSCPAAGDCTAAGTYEDAAGAYVPFADSEVDGVWQPAAALGLPGDASATPDGAGDPVQNDLYVNGVSCASAGNCTAVGSYDATRANDVKAFTVTEVAGGWGAAAAIGLPSGGGAGAGAATNPQAALYSVTCQSPGDCLAAGTYVDAAGENVALIARQSGGSWASAGADLSSPYDPSQGGEYWASVACAPSGYCATGGYVGDADSGLQDAFLLDAPAAPGGATATRGGSGSGASQATVAWSAPADTGGLPISGYTVTADDLTDPAAGGQTLAVRASATSASFSALASGDSYSFTVTAESLLGTGVPATTAATGTTATTGATTAAATGAAVTPPSSQQPAGTASGSVRPSRTRIAASLKALLKPAGMAAELRRLRRGHRYELRYRALEPGRLTVRWYHETRTRGQRRTHRTLVAAGTVRATHAAQTLTLSMRLTPAGRRWLSGSASLQGHPRLITVVSFAAAGATAVTRTAASG